MTDLKTAWYADHSPGRGKLLTVAPPSFSIDGANLDESVPGTVHTVTLTTSSSPLLIVVAVAYKTPATSCTVAATGLSFTKQVTIVDARGIILMDIWSAVAATALTNLAITGTLNGAGKWGMIAFGAKGIATSGSFDATPVGFARAGVDNPGETPSVSSVVADNTGYSVLVTFIKTSTDAITLPSGYTAIMTFDASARMKAGWKTIHGTFNGTVTLGSSASASTPWAMAVPVLNPA